MKATHVLKAKTPKTAAKRFHEWVNTHCGASKYGRCYLWDPEETEARGWGNGWAVCWEEGPFEWTIDLERNLGFPVDWLGTDYWYAEAFNGFVLNFYEA